MKTCRGPKGEATINKVDLKNMVKFTACYSSSIPQNVKICFRCGKSNHILPWCRDRKKYSKKRQNYSKKVHLKVVFRIASKLMYSNGSPTGGPISGPLTMLPHRMIILLKISSFLARKKVNLFDLVTAMNELKLFSGKNILRSG